MITSNDINSLIVRPLKKGVTLHAILDACHSAIALDLSYAYKKQNGIWKWEDSKPLSKDPIVKHTSGGLAICFSACEDNHNQMYADTSALGSRIYGFMSYLFTKTIREHSEITYGALLEKMHPEVVMPRNGFLKRIFRDKLEQFEARFEIVVAVAIDNY